jgi:hypothetical protein
MPAILWSVCIASCAVGLGTRSRRSRSHCCDLRPVGAIGHEFRHLHGLVVVRDHVLHEHDVIG